MTYITQGATQVLRLDLPTGIDLTGTDIYFSIEQFNRTVLEITGDSSITFEGSTVYVALSQIDTLSLDEGDAKAQINLVYNRGASRLPTLEAPIKILRNQIKRVLT